MIQKNSDLIKPIMNVYDMKKNSVLTHLVPRQITKDFQMLTFFHTTNLFNLSLYRSKQSYMMMLSCLFACSLFEERNGNNINARSCCLSSAKIFFRFLFHSHVLDEKFLSCYKEILKLPKLLKKNF